MNATGRAGVLLVLGAAACANLDTSAPGDAEPSIPEAQKETVEARLPRPLDDEHLREMLQRTAGGEIPPERVADAAARSRRIRADALAAAASSDASAAAGVAREILAERAFVADRARGGTMQMLRDLSQSNVRMLGLVGDREAFSRHFTRRETGPTIDGPAWRVADGLAHGAMLVFPAGAHAWPVDSLRRTGEFPRDLVVAGAGMDATLVRVDEIGVDSEVTNLTFRDCTIDCSEYFTDLRGSNPITLRLERCRVVAFDKGSGGSVMLAANTAAFFATDCRFEAGYGRADPGFGNLFRVGSGLLARCEGCVFRGPFRSVFDDGSKATYVFSACRFERMGPAFEQVLAAPPEGVRFENCSFVEPLEKGTRLEQRPLSDLNSAWPSKTR